MPRFCRESKFLALAFLFSILAPVLSMAQTQMQWVKSYDDALRQAAREKKFIVLDVSASW